MNVHLPGDLEASIRSMVQGGRFASVDEAMSEAARLLVQQAPPAGAPMTLDEFHQQLIRSGFMLRLPNTAADFDDPDDQPVVIEGEPLSETIIRERR